MKTIEPSTLYGAVVLAEAGTLQFFAGRPPQSVAVDGRQATRLFHGVADETWHRHEVRLRASGGARVRFRITTRYAWAKHFCFYARSEGGGP